mgnify:FL=1
MQTVARGVVVLPKSVTPKRIEENLKLITLDAEDLKVLNGLGEKHTHRAVRVSPATLSSPGPTLTWAPTVAAELGR